MSFSSDIKKELVRIEAEKKCCIRAELGAFICFGASVMAEDGGFSIKISTENASAAKRCFMLIKKIFNPKIELEIKKSKAGRGGFAYVLNIDDHNLCYDILKETNLIDSDFEKNVSFRVSPEFTEKDHCVRAFIRGAFLGSGSTANPEKGYHMEFVTHHHNLCNDFIKLLKLAGFEAKVIKRKSNHVIYFKGGDEIEELLGFMGAVNCMMEFTNVRIMKYTRNNVNRKVNCETANMDKALTAAWSQIESIKKIREAKEFDNLPDSLKEIALLREENPEATLTELANKIVPAISKSGVSHRLKKLMEIAEKLR